MTDQLLLCTDLDRTLIPNGEAPESPQAMAYFHRLVAQPQVTLAYVTGRHLDLIETAIHQYLLPRPQFAIADVGSSLYTWEDSRWHRWSEWDQHLAIDWPTDGAECLHALLAQHLTLILQESEKQSRNKLSYYVALEEDHKMLMAAIQNILQEENIPANLIWSVDPEKQLGLLDIMPPQADKYQAILFLMQAQNYSASETVFAGDSGNDEAVLLSPLPGILVANAHQDLKQKLSTAPTQKSVYLAQGNCLGMNGNYSAGILEGIFHYFPECKTWLNLT